MLKPLQDNPLATDRIAPKLFEKPSFALHVKALADELFSDEQWADMYSEIGRTAHSPKVMTVALILQRHQDLSDRQMAHATRFDLEVKAALGLAWDDPGIPKSCFGDFRARLLTHGRECEAFNLFNQRLVSQGWSKPKEALIVDATHLEANATPHNPHQLIRTATRAVLRQVAKERPDLYQAFEERIALRTDTALSGGHDYYLLPEAERNERFGEAVTEARVVIAELKRRRRLSGGLKAKVELLETILEERATEGDAPVDPDDAPPNRTTSHRDPDARWGAKGKDKYFHGTSARS